MNELVNPNGVSSTADVDVNDDNTLCVVKVPKAALEAVENIIRQYQDDELIGATISITCGKCGQQLRVGERIRRGDAQVFVDEVIHTIKARILCE